MKLDTNIRFHNLHYCIILVIKFSKGNGNPAYFLNQGVQSEDMRNPIAYQHWSKIWSYYLWMSLFSLSLFLMLVERICSNVPKVNSLIILYSENIYDIHLFQISFWCKLVLLISIIFPLNKSFWAGICTKILLVLILTIAMSNKKLWKAVAYLW